MSSIRIGTRGSKLALWQAHWVQSQLSRHGHDVELVKISTKGDVSTASLSQVGGQGLFTKEIQRELLAERVDVAVHSLKDLPTEVVPDLTLAAVPERETTVDCLISRGGEQFTELAEGAAVGTGSSRRGAQLSAWRKDVFIKDIRGNVDTRLKKLDDGEFDAIILAGAGLHRLELSDRITEVLPQTHVLPAIGQGALGLECRSEDTETKAALADLNHADSFDSVVAERTLLASLLAGCLAPVAALATVESGELRLKARVLAFDGSQMLETEVAGPQGDAIALGKQAAIQLLDNGAEELIAIARERQIGG